MNRLSVDNKDGIEFLHFIFERELKPPFSSDVEADEDGDYRYFNRDYGKIGWLDSTTSFILRYEIYKEFKYKVCQAFELSTDDWWSAINPHLKSWMENQINIKLSGIY